MKALITGVSGFVGHYLALNLLANGYKVWGSTRKKTTDPIEGLQVIKMDFSNQEELRSVLEEIKPDVVFHLSGQSSVKYSWDRIEETFQSNLMDTINLLEAIKHSSLITSIKVISVGSSEEYGMVSELPITENTTINPINPYGLSKHSVGILARYYNNHFGVNIIHARAFNHIGPGQMLGFVTSDFTKQVVDIEMGNVEPVLYVGDLSSKRDFTDVRDIVEAYRLLFEKGDSGQTYNVCSGVCTSIRDILESIVSMSSKSIEIIVDEKKLRPNDVPEYYGSNKKLTEITGWSPKIQIKTSLYDIYQYWKKKQI
jgi:GDP-4-dehydro-6-deoxy-D-mannose reductase